MTTDKYNSNETGLRLEDTPSENSAVESEQVTNNIYDNTVENEDEAATAAAVNCESAIDTDTCENKVTLIVGMSEVIVNHRKEEITKETELQEIKVVVDEITSFESVQIRTVQ